MKFLMLLTCSTKCLTENPYWQKFRLHFFLYVKEPAKSAESFPRIWEISMCCSLAFFCCFMLPTVWIWIEMACEGACVIFVLIGNGQTRVFWCSVRKEGRKWPLMLNQFGEDDYLSQFLISVPPFSFGLWFGPWSSELHNLLPKLL